MFLVCQVEEYRIVTKQQTTCFYLKKSFFKKTKRSGTGLPTSFSGWFLKKNISFVIFYYLINFTLWLSLFREILSNTCIVIVCLPGCEVTKFEINLIFLIKTFFYKTINSRQIFKYLEKEKSIQDEIKHVFIIFKGLSLKKHMK